jgi:ribonucleotide reductase beta subunit family protein with ferritin-like domain
MSTEPICNEENRRFTLFPIKYHSLFELYKKQLSAFWKAEEIDFSNDYNDYLLLNDDEKHFIEMNLAFFAASDGIVNFNLSTRFLQDVKIIEAQVAYTYQMMMENIHCVSADTKILTDKGYFKIIDLLNKKVNVWNGKQFSNTEIKYTGDSRLFKVTLNNGMSLDCTPNHKWFIREGNQLHPERCHVVKKETSSLEKGSVIAMYQLPVIDIEDIDEFLNPYIHGFFCGDGSYCNKYPIIDLYSEKRELLKYFEIDKYQVDDNYNKIRFYITNKINKEKFYVPVNYSLKTKLKWLEGICDSDGCVNLNSKKNATSIQISNTNFDFLKNIQLMLTTLGINSNIRLNHEECYRLLPDQKGNHKQYLCKKCYILYITIENVNKLINLGFEPKRLKIIKNFIKGKPKLLKVESIIELEGIHKTYCFNEPIEHAGIFNGILTGQSEVYSLMLDNIVRDPVKKEYLFNSIETVKSVKMMADWAFKWIDSDKSFAHRVIAFAVIEGIFFSGAFASIYWLKKYKASGKRFLDGLIKSNEFIARDEGLHTEFACVIYSLLENKLPFDEVKNIVSEGVEVAKNFVNDALPVRLIGMNEESMRNYIEYVADRLLVVLGYKKLYNKTNPFSFMETIGMLQKTNFFETRPTEYQSAHVFNKDNKIDYENEDF